MVVRRDHFDYEMLMVVAGFLAGDTANTLLAYQQDLRIFGSSFLGVEARSCRLSR